VQWCFYTAAHRFTGACSKSECFCRSLLLDVTRSHEWEFSGRGTNYLKYVICRWCGAGAGGRREEVILKLLASRFSPPTEAVQACPRRVQTAPVTELHAVVERLLTAQTLEERDPALSR
jgi:hypothetical protein